MKNVYDEGQEQPSHVWLRAALIIGCLIMLVAMRWLATKLNWRMSYIRNHFRDRVKRIIIIGIVCVIIITIIIAVLNNIAKKEEYDKHYELEDQIDDPREIKKVIKKK